MAKNEKTSIEVNGAQYALEDLTDKQKAMVNHIADLERKLASARFNVDQLAFGREAFVNALAQSLENDTTDVAAE